MALFVPLSINDINGRMLLLWELLACVLPSEKYVNDWLSAISNARWSAAPAFAAVGARATATRLLERLRWQIEQESPDLAGDNGRAARTRCLQALREVKSAPSRKARRAKLLKTATRAARGNRRANPAQLPEVWNLRLLQVTFESPFTRRNADRLHFPVQLSPEMAGANFVEQVVTVALSDPGSTVSGSQHRLLALACELRSGELVGELFHLESPLAGEASSESLSARGRHEIRRFLKTLHTRILSTNGSLVLPPPGSRKFQESFYEFAEEESSAASVRLLLDGVPSCELEAMPHIRSDIRGSCSLRVLGHTA